MEETKYDNVEKVGHKLYNKYNVQLPLHWEMEISILEWESKLIDEISEFSLDIVSAIGDSGTISTCIVNLACLLYTSPYLWGIPSTLADEGGELFKKNMKLSYNSNDVLLEDSVSENGVDSKNVTWVEVTNLRKWDSSIYMLLSLDL